jgi:hypothetical protein
VTLRAFALGATLAIHAVFAWLVLGPGTIETPLFREPQRTSVGREPPQPAHAATSARERVARAGAVRTPPPFEPGEPAAKFVSPEERAAYERGAAYENARRAAIARWRDRAYGEDIGAIMRQPVPQAWRSLEALVEAGDPVAADALLELASCAVDIPGRGATYRRLRDSAIEGLAPADAAFVHGALDTELLGIENDARTCAAAGLGESRLTALAERRFRANGTPESPPAGENRLAWLDYYQRAFPPQGVPEFGIDPRPETAPFLDLLDASVTPTEWEAFARDAPDDPVLAMRVAYCAMSRCADLPPVAWNSADRFIARAAEYGSPQAISRVIEQRAETHALAEAHAWAEFGMWVIASGCFPVAQSLEYAQLARQRQALAARLTAVQFAEARVRLAGLMRAHGDAALAAQGCLP